MTDDVLIQGIRDKDPGAFHAIYEQLYGLMMVYAYNLLNSRDDAQEIVNDAFLKLWQTRQNFVSAKHVRNFLIRLVKNNGINLMKKAKNRARLNQKIFQSVSSIDNSVEEKRQQAMIVEELYRFISKLPPRSREVFTLTYLEGHSRSEVAQMLDISENTVRNLNYSAMKSLRIAMEISPLIAALIFLLVYFSRFF